MRVLFQNRPQMFDLPAGDTIQMQKTKEYLGKLGVHVEINNDPDLDLSKYDLVHAFNTQQVDHTYGFFVNAQKQGKPFVLTPIFIDLSEYNQKGRYGWDKYVYKLIKNPDIIETLKNLRHKKRGGKLIQKGYEKKKAEVIENCTALCCLSEAEKSLLCNKYSVKGQMEIINNGVDLMFAQGSADWFEKEYGMRNHLLCVAKIEPLKNQLRIIKALLETEIPMVFIGRTNPYHLPYFNDFLSLAEIHDEKIVYIEHLEPEKLASAYKSAKVHVNASWFENAPLVNLEAGLAGCNIVATDRGFGSEYLDDQAWFCNPSDPESIKQACLDAYEADQSDELSQYISENYTWDKTAAKLFELYRQLV